MRTRLVFLGIGALCLWAGCSSGSRSRGDLPVSSSLHARIVVRDVIPGYGDRFVVDIGHRDVDIPRSAAVVAELLHPEDLAGRWVLLLAPEDEELPDGLVRLGAVLEFDVSDMLLRRATRASSEELRSPKYVPRILTGMLRNIRISEGAIPKGAIRKGPDRGQNPPTPYAHTGMKVAHIGLARSGMLADAFKQLMDY